MGDRANVKFIEQDGTSLFLYTHWRGSDLPEIIQSALSHKQRWDDEQYLARIIFCEMIKGDESGHSGFGISTYCGDGDDKILEINVSNQQVGINENLYSFNDYVKLKLSGNRGWSVLRGCRK
jgi:hypothetical protein